MEHFYDVVCVAVVGFERFDPSRTDSGSRKSLSLNDQRSEKRKKKKNERRRWAVFDVGPDLESPLLLA